MAYTLSTVVAGTAVGNQLMRVIKVTADAAEGNITTGLKQVVFCNIQPLKGASMPVAHVNADSTGTVSNGIVGVSAASSGNQFHLVVYGS